ncbi:MAG: PIN domain-containing protein [Candidatus Korarchaeota archaeon]|nr:PIN domain-containing protein [Candidatus Korarchaeota archaeon]
MRNTKASLRARSVRIVLDTGVLVEYIVKRAPYRHKVVEVFRNADEGDVRLFMSPITLSEALYVVSRIYRDFIHL